MSIKIPGLDQVGKPDLPHPDAAPKTGIPPTKGLSSEQRRPLDEGEIREAMETLEKSFRLFNHRLQFSINREINRIVVKVIDRATDKVIKEIPPEEIQRMAAKMREMIGLLVDEKI